MREVDRPQFAVDETGRIVVDPQTRFGKPIVAGTRIGVSDIMNYLAGGMSVDEIPTEFPQVDREDVLAALRYAADIADAQRVTPGYRVGKPDLCDLIDQMVLDEELDVAEVEGVLRRRLEEGREADAGKRAAARAEREAATPAEAVPA